MERRDFAFDQAMPPSGGKGVHWGSNEAAGDDGLGADECPRKSSVITPAQTPASSGGPGAPIPSSPVAPDVQAANAARLQTGGMPSEEDSSVEEEEVVEGYQCLMRQSPKPYGNEETRTSASAAFVEPSPPVMV